MATSNARAPIPVPRATPSSSSSVPRPSDARSTGVRPIVPHAAPPRPSSVVPRPQPAAPAKTGPKSVKPAVARAQADAPAPAPKHKKELAKSEVPAAAASGVRVASERVRDADSESRLVAVRSLQPTLPGIGPEEIAALFAAAAAAAAADAAAAQNPAEPEVCELDEKFLVEERSGTLIDAFEAAASPEPVPVQGPTVPVPAVPLLRIVAAPVAPPPAIPMVDPMPRTSHVPPPKPVAVAVQPAPAPAPRVSLCDPSRVSLTDPMDVLFDAAYELCFLQTAVEGAHHCMASACRAVRGRAALVHLVDVHTGEFVTVAGMGDGADRQVLSRHEDDDWLLSASVFKRKPLTMEYGGEVSSRPLPRHAALGSPKNVVVVPVIGWGRALAVLEVIDAEEAMLAGGRAESALAYLAERFAEFLGEREIVLAPAVGDIAP